MTVDQIRFEALRNAIYHGTRKAFLGGANRWLSFIIIIFGAAAIGDLSKWLHVGNQTVFAAIATAAATLQLVFDFGGRAALHDYLQRRYYELIADIVDNPGEEHAVKWEARLIRLYADEPTPMRALDAIARNAAVEALGYKQSDRVRVTWCQSLLSQVWPFNESDFPNIEPQAST